MSLKQFLSGLAIMSIAQISIIMLMMLFGKAMQSHTGFIVTTILAMIFFCILLYLVAKRFSRSSNKRLYIQLIMLAVFVKMLLCLVLIIGYMQGFHPVDQSFIWPFLVIYLTSTIYEVIFLEKVGREKQSSPT